MKEEQTEDEQIAKLAQKRMVSAELEDFLRYLHSPWSVIWRNILVGLMRGLGTVFGATVVVAAALWLMAAFVDFPLIGRYVSELRDKINEVAQETRYSDDFVRLQSSVDQMNANITQQNALLKEILDQRE